MPGKLQVCEVRRRHEREYMSVRCESDYGPCLRPEWGNGKGMRDRDGGDAWAVSGKRGTAITEDDK